MCVHADFTGSFVSLKLTPEQLNYWTHYLGKQVTTPSWHVISIIINYISSYLISLPFPDVNYLITPLFIFFAGGQGLGKVHQDDSRKMTTKAVLVSTQGK